MIRASVFPLRSREGPNGGLRRFPAVRGTAMEPPELTQRGD